MFKDMLGDVANDLACTGRLLPYSGLPELVYHTRRPPRLPRDAQIHKDVTEIMVAPWLLHRRHSITDAVRLGAGARATHQMHARPSASRSEINAN